MATSFAQRMVSALQTALASNAGVVSVQVDGTTVTYNRQQAIDELRLWQREVSKANGRKPRISSIDLGSAF